MFVCVTVSLTDPLAAQALCLVDRGLSREAEHALERPGAQLLEIVQLIPGPLHALPGAPWGSQRGDLSGRAVQSSSEGCAQKEEREERGEGRSCRSEKKPAMPVICIGEQRAAQTLRAGPQTAQPSNTP